MKESDLQGIITAVEQLERLTGGHLGNWKGYLQDAATIWHRCPHKVGDRVMLTETPVIDGQHSWGWLGAKHFLIKGAIATIVQREFYNGHFLFGLNFDNESWIDGKGKRNPVDRPAMYMFWEDKLMSVSYQALSCEAL